MKTILFEQFCDDFNIPMAPAGHKHQRDGWIQVECPFCSGNPGYHLGFNIEKSYLNCWRCGFHRKEEVMGELAGEPAEYVFKRLRKYFSAEEQADTSKDFKEDKVKAVKCLLPSATGSMMTMHREYLVRRKYNPDKLERIWGLKGTSQFGSYKFRIIAPIYFHGRLVSYQGRDTTDRSKLRYKACPSDKEVIDHKNVLYGYDLADKSRVVVVEGIADAWRLGQGCVATFGVKFTKSQLLLLSRFERRYIFFDGDSEGIKQGEVLANELSGFSGNTEIITISGVKDPGAMKQKSADSLMRELGFDRI